MCILLCHLHEKDAVLDPHLNLHTVGWPVINIANWPFQELRPAITRIATSARTQAQQDKRTSNTHLHSIDHMALNKALKIMPPDEAGLLRLITQCASRDNILVSKTGWCETDVCEWCGSVHADITHILRFCPHFSTRRPALIAHHCPGLDANYLSPAMLFGIPPSMAPFPDMAFWGYNLDEATITAQRCFGAGDSIK